MARYYFDIRDACGFHRDEVGDECADFEEAREQCQGLLTHIARDELPDSDLHTITCDVRDRNGRLVDRGELKYRGTRSPV